MPGRPISLRLWLPQWLYGRLFTGRCRSRRRHLGPAFYQLPARVEKTEKLAASTSIAEARNYRAAGVNYARSRNFGEVIKQRA